MQNWAKRLPLIIIASLSTSVCLASQYEIQDDISLEAAEASEAMTALYNRAPASLDASPDAAATSDAPGMPLILSDKGYPSGVAEDQRQCRLDHAKELLGKYYKRSAVQVGENVPKINNTIYRWVKSRLPAEYKKQYKKIAQAVIDESFKQEFDPVFLVSIIQSESGFKPRQIGGVGEIGLMQIRPSTAKWIAKKNGMPWKGKKTLFDPVANIRIGAAYLGFLRERFDMHARLYIAAYNMGQTNVDIAREHNIWPKEYSSHVMKHYVEFYNMLKNKEKRSIASKSVALQ
jgi:soluble lytic murein transglycosylase